MKKKVLSLVFATTVVGSLVAGCGSGGGGDKSSDSGDGDKVKIRLVSISTDENQTAILDDYIKKNAAERFPNVEVEYEPGGGGEDMANKMKTYNASGDLPDVWYDTTDYGTAILSAGNMLDLTKYVEEDGFIDKYEMPEALKHSDGKIYTLSSGADTYFTPRIFYNKQIFKDNGIEIPKTWDDFMAACEKLKSNSVVPMAIPGKGGWSPQLYLIQTLTQCEDPQVVQDLLANKTDFMNPAVVEAAKKVETMVKSGVFPDGIANLDYGPAVEMFTSGKTAMFGGFSWEVSNFGSDENIGMFMWPSSNPDYPTNSMTQYWGSPLNGYAVNPNSENLETAIQFAEFCVEMEAQFYAEQGSMLNYQTGIEASEVSPLMQENIDLYNGTELRIPSLSVNAMDTATAAEYGNLGAKLLTGEYLAEDYCKDFNKAWEENTWFD